MRLLHNSQNYALHCNHSALIPIRQLKCESYQRYLARLCHPSPLWLQSFILRHKSNADLTNLILNLSFICPNRMFIYILILSMLCLKSKRVKLMLSLAHTLSNVCCRRPVFSIFVFSFFLNLFFLPIFEPMHFHNSVFMVCMVQWGQLDAVSYTPWPEILKDHMKV